MSDHLRPEQNPIHPDGAQPFWPTFAPKPAPLPAATSLHAEDIVAVSLGGRAPEVISLGRFRSMIHDGKTDGVVHVGTKDGRVETASFALLRSFLCRHAAPQQG